MEVRGEVQAVGVGGAEVGLDPALEPQVVLVARVDDAPDPQALALQQAVEHRRSRVDARDDRRESPRSGCGAPLAERVARGGDEPDRLVLGRRLRLADDERAVLVDDERVGHRAARVDREHPRHSQPVLATCGPCLRRTRFRHDRGQRYPRPRSLRIRSEPHSVRALRCAAGMLVTADRLVAGLRGQTMPRRSQRRAREDRRPHRGKRRSEHATRDRFAALLVLDRHLYAAHDPVVAAEAGFAGGEPDEQRLRAGHLRAPEAQRDIAARDRRKVAPEHLDRASLPVVGRDDHVGPVCVARDVVGHRRPAELVLVVAANFEDAEIDRRTQRKDRHPGRQQQDQHEHIGGRPSRDATPAGPAVERRRARREREQHDRLGVVGLAAEQQVEEDRRGHGEAERTQRRRAPEACHARAGHGHRERVRQQQQVRDVPGPRLVRRARHGVREPFHAHPGVLRLPDEVRHHDRRCDRRRAGQAAGQKQITAPDQAACHHREQRHRERVLRLEADPHRQAESDPRAPAEGEPQRQPQHRHGCELVEGHRLEETVRRQQDRREADDRSGESLRPARAAELARHQGREHRRACSGQRREQAQARQPAPPERPGHGRQERGHRRELDVAALQVVSGDRVVELVALPPVAAGEGHVQERLREHHREHGPERESDAPRVLADAPRQRGLAQGDGHRGHRAIGSPVRGSVTGNRIV